MMKGDRLENPFGTIVGKNSFFRAISDLEQVHFEGDTDISAAVTSCVNTGSRNGLSVIISDFLTDHDWKKAVDFLCYKGRQVLLIQVLSPDELEPAYSGRVNLIDSESEDISDVRNMKIRITRNLQLAYEDALREIFGEIKSFCSSRNVGYIAVRSDKPIEKMLFGELLKVGIMA